MSQKSTARHSSLPLFLHADVPATCQTCLVTIVPPGSIRTSCHVMPATCHDRPCLHGGQCREGWNRSGRRQPNYGAEVLKSHWKYLFYKIEERYFLWQIVKKVDGVVSLIADPFRCNSTNRQNPLLQQNQQYFWTNDAILISFNSCNVLNLHDIVCIISGSPLHYHLGLAAP